MVISFFVIAPSDLVLMLKYAGWGLRDLRGLGTMRNAMIWLDAISVAAKKEAREAKKGK